MKSFVLVALVLSSASASKSVHNKLQLAQAKTKSKSGNKANVAAASHAGECVDGTGVDSFGDGCWWYDSYPSGCGGYDTSTFSSNEQCCSCGGGSTGSSSSGSGWGYQCATEGGYCECSTLIVYGAPGGADGLIDTSRGTAILDVPAGSGGLDCTNGVFGDPLYGTVKACVCANE